MTVGIVLALLQLAFALTWVTYAAHLPALAAQAGIAKSDVPWILLADQAIFVVCDLLAGIYADKLAPRFGRLGIVLAGVTIGSCLAFLAIPLVAPAGAAPLLAMVVLWSATSSALRAPPLILLGHHASKPQRAWLAALYTFGMGFAGILGPFAAGKLVAIDPRIVFGLASATLVVATLALVVLDRRGSLVAPPVAEPIAPDPRIRPVAMFVLVVVLLAIGQQILVQVNASPAYLKFVKPADLGDVLPMFWVGFAITSLPAGFAAKQIGATRVIAVAGVIGIGATLGITQIGSLDALIGLQVLAGGAWGAMLSSAFVAAGSSGKLVGAIASLLAASTVLRIGLVATGTTKRADVVDALPHVPIIAWAAGTVVAMLLAVRRRGTPAA